MSLIQCPVDKGQAASLSHFALLAHSLVSAASIRDGMSTILVSWLLELVIVNCLSRAFASLWLSSQHIRMTMTKALYQDQRWN